MMTQKNIDLELQALELLQKQLGQSIGAYDGHAKSSPTPQQKVAKQEAEEEEALQNALKLSKKESEMQMMEDQEMEKLMALAVQESLKMHRQESLKRQDEEASKQGIQDEPPPAETEEKRKTDSGMQDKSSAKETEAVKDERSSPGHLNIIPPIGKAALQHEMSGEEAAQMWIQSAKSELENRQLEPPVIKQHKSVSRVNFTVEPSRKGHFINHKQQK